MPESPASMKWYPGSVGLVALPINCELEIEVLQIVVYFMLYQQCGVVINNPPKQLRGRK